MDENERDTHFKNFARLLYDEVASTNPLDFSGERTQAIIARRAYDLALYILEYAPQLMTSYPHLQTVQEALTFLPDMTEWPTP